MKGSMEKKPYHYRTCMYQINGEVSWPICFYAFFQDDKFKVNNLISNGGFKKWLTSAADKSGQAEVTLQLKKAVYLSYIDLGKFVLAASDQTLFHSLATHSHFTINPFYFTLTTLLGVQRSIHLPHDTMNISWYRQYDMYRDTLNVLLKITHKQGKFVLAASDMTLFHLHFTINSNHTAHSCTTRQCHWFKIHFIFSIFKVWMISNWYWGKNFLQLRLYSNEVFAYPAS